MSTKKRSGTEERKGPVPGPDTFDFDDYIAGISTFPKDSHTVCLDQEAGSELVKYEDRLKELKSERKVLVRQQGDLKESGSLSFVDDDSENLAEKLEEIEKDISSLEEAIPNLKQRVQESRLKIHLQAGTVQKLGSVDHKAEKEFIKANGQGSENDMEYNTRKANHVIAARLDAYCKKITLHDGTEKEPPGRESFARLMDRLSSAESVRLMNRLNEFLDTSSNWADRLDAGFPSGGSDLDFESVGSPGVEDSSVVEDSPIDDADRGGI